MLPASAAALEHQLQRYVVSVRAYGEVLFERTLTYLPGVGGDHIDASFRVPLSSHSDGTNQATAYRSLDVALNQPHWDADTLTPLLEVTLQLPADRVLATGGDPRIRGGSVHLSESVSLQPGEFRVIAPSEQVEIRVQRQ
jgi:hypothetical protein